MGAQMGTRAIVLLTILHCSCHRAEPTDLSHSRNSGTNASSTDQPQQPACTPSRSIQEALEAASSYLIGQQSSDGAWRSEVYATFRDGKALTPLVVVALQKANTAAKARRKGAEFLAHFVRSDGTIDEGEDGIDYPVYTASLSVIALSHPENADLRMARDSWLRFLLERQLTENLGWSPDDKPYGGWGYCRVLPRKPPPNTFAPPLIESNLSATRYALEALQIAGLSDETIYRKAWQFLRNCQNPDGGFHFIYDDPVRNKAGQDRESGLFHSYGSTSADGFRALRLLCQKLPKDPELAEARDKAQHWLISHFRSDYHPGKYIPSHERNREAVYYYYAAAAAEAFKDCSMSPSHWAESLAQELLRRQRPDGSWMNPLDLVREDDPHVATCLAMTALSACQPARNQ